MNLSGILIFCDGASSGNPGPGGWGAVIVTPGGHVLEIGGAEPDTTNNRMELEGTIASLARIAAEPGPVTLCTDSMYVIQGITKWIWGWRARDWKTAEGKPVANVEYWKRLATVVAKRGKEGAISWQHVRGHANIPGNERVDAIAVAFSKGRRIDLYRGPLLGYSVAIHDIPETAGPLPVRERTKDGEKKAPALCYLSLINGKLERHKTWPECEARVKGRPGAKFKRAQTAQEESEILRSWGVGAGAGVDGSGTSGKS